MRSTTHGKLMHILLVEDNPGDVLLIQEAFRELEHECEFSVTCDGETALAKLLGQADVEAIETPDLILLDLNLPRKSGLDTLREIKSSDKLRSIPVLVLTSSRAKRDLVAAYDLHCNAYLCKPATFDGYVEHAQRIADFWFKATVLSD